MSDKKHDLIFSDPPNNKNPIDLVFGEDDKEDPVRPKNKFDLIFCDKPNNRNPINLTFGDDCEDGPIIEPVDHDVFGEASLHAFSCDSDIEQDYGIDENLVTSLFDALFNQSVFIQSSHAAHIKEADQLRFVGFGAWNEAYLSAITAQNDWIDSSEFKNDQIATWCASDLIKDDRQAHWVSGEIFDHDGDISWHQARLDLSNGRGFWHRSDHDDHYSSASFNSADITDRKSKALWGDGEEFRLDRIVKWNQADIPRCGISVRPPIEPIKPPPDHWDVVRDLIFCHKPNNKNPINLIFGLKCCTSDTSIPRKKVYFVTNDIDIFRKKDGIRLAPFSVDLNADEDNPIWNGTITLAYKHLEYVSDYPEIEINLNQLKWIMKVQNISETFVFNQRRLSISLVSVTNKLNSNKMKAISINEDATAQQIAYRQLQGIDLDTGITLDWQSQDWDVPAGLIAYDNQTPFDIIARLMNASDDVLMSHYHKPELMTRKRYKQNYWENITPIFTIPFDAILDFSVEEERAKSYDSVIVTGESIGVSAHVRRFGYSAEYPADMVVDRLITDEKVARQRGMNVISRSGVKQNVVVSMPLHKEIPYLYPRDIIAIESDKGFITSLGVNATITNDAITARHTMNIEKHLRDNF